MNTFSSDVGLREKYIQLMFSVCGHVQEICPFFYIPLIIKIRDNLTVFSAAPEGIQTEKTI